MLRLLRPFLVVLASARFPSVGAAVGTPPHPVVRSLESLDTFSTCRAEYAKLAAQFLEASRERRLGPSGGEEGGGGGEEGGEEGEGGDGPDSFEPVGTPTFWKHVILVLSCVALAGLAAGLTMGLVSIEPLEMEIILTTQDKDMPASKDKMKLKEDQDAAQKVLPLIQDHHRLLVTLLLMNSIANEALPLFLDKLVPAWLAVGLSVTLVLLFGEIIPSAIFTGSNQLNIAAKFARFVVVCRFLLAPIAYPIAMFLDHVLGEDHKGRYNFAQLRAIVGIHANLRSNDKQPVAFKCHDDQELGIITTEQQHNFLKGTSVVFTGTATAPAESTILRDDGTLYYVKPCPPLTGRDMQSTFKLYTEPELQGKDLVTFGPGELTSGAFRGEERDELKIMQGVVNLTHMTAADAFVPLHRVSMLERQQRLTLEAMTEVLKVGYSRLPVYEGHKHNIRGFILVKKLIVVSPQDDGGKGRCVDTIGLEELVVVPLGIPMLELLNRFQEAKCHIALVTNQPEVVTAAWASKKEIPPDIHMAGIITLEDVIEKLLQEEIEDEHDAQQQLSKLSSRFGGASFSWGSSADCVVSPLQQPLLSSAPDSP